LADEIDLNQIDSRLQVAKSLLPVLLAPVRIAFVRRTEELNGSNHATMLIHNLDVPLRMMRQFQPQWFGNRDGRIRFGKRGIGKFLGNIRIWANRARGFVFFINGNALLDTRYLPVSPQEVDR